MANAKSIQQSLPDSPGNPDKLLMGIREQLPPHVLVVMLAAGPIRFNPGWISLLKSPTRIGSVADFTNPGPPRRLELTTLHATPPGLQLLNSGDVSKVRHLA